MCHLFFCFFFSFYFFYKSLGFGQRPDNVGPEELVLRHCSPIHPMGFVMTGAGRGGGGLPGKPTEDLLEGFSEQQSHVMNS